MNKQTYMVVDILEFDLGGELYAMDIRIAREIVEMLPITPIPRAPDHVSGLLNLRGEITTIINIHHLLGIKPTKNRNEQNIMVLIPEAFDNTSVGMIVDEVHSVLTVDEENIDTEVKGVSSGLDGYIHGIIKLSREDTTRVASDTVGDESQKRLIIWIDIKKILFETIESAGIRQE